MEEAVRESLVPILRESTRLQLGSAIQKRGKIDYVVGCSKLMSDPESKPRFGRQCLHNADRCVLTDIQAFAILGDSSRPLEKAAHLGKARKEIGIYK